MNRKKETQGPREWAMANQKSLVATYRALWEGRLPGASKQDGKWLIPSGSVIRSRKQLAEEVA